MEFNSAIYEGQVSHERLRPKYHSFRYSVYSLLLDLDELPLLDKSFWAFTYNRPGPIAFYDADHGPTTGEPLRPWVENLLRSAGLQPDGGPINILCYPRILGYTFNPLSVFFCYNHDGGLLALLYEVCNTFKERHTYVLRIADSDSLTIKQSCKKELYVSPFIGMKCEYHFRIAPPTDTVNITIRQEDKDGILLAASFVGKHRVLDSNALRSIFLRFPFLSLKIILGIHWEGAQLWLKGLRVFRHQPAKSSVQSSVTSTRPLRR
ncbi:MAG: DUF1365 domain-containing protein [Rhodospirillaceae bacterium TMED8]|nr:DUF1365 domain-containing protein [Magnetovibrio sp.]OUT49272.1 MAG: DUF1365 domain-containing protein [Rhodospirillaceae bacterium TMED8]|tara:strand:- start:369 stop:1160 length:792 start_codon:yes stop_codon:yes gene_type:complete